MTVNFNALRDDIAEAIRVDGKRLSKTELVSKFSKRGASPASLYSWINQAINAEAARQAAAVPNGQPVIQDRIEAQTERGLVALRAVDSVPPIPFLERLQGCLRELDAMMGMAKKDGQIVNVKLAYAVVDLIGKTLQRAATIQSMIEDQQAQRAFLQAVAQVIRDEEPAVRDRLIVRMKTLNSEFLS